MSNIYINIYNYIKNHKLDDDTLNMLPGAVLSIALVVYCNLV